MAVMHDKDSLTTVIRIMREIADDLEAGRADFRNACLSNGWAYEQSDDEFRKCKPTGERIFSVTFSVND